MSARSPAHPAAVHRARAVPVLREEVLRAEGLHTTTCPQCAVRPAVDGEPLVLHRRAAPMYALLAAYAVAGTVHPDAWWMLFPPLLAAAAWTTRGFSLRVRLCEPCRRDHHRWKRLRSLAQGIATTGIIAAFGLMRLAARVAAQDDVLISSTGNVPSLVVALGSVGLAGYAAAAAAHLVSRGRVLELAGRGKGRVELTASASLARVVEAEQPAALLR